MPILISYVSQGRGIPLEVKLNLDLGYTQVILKAETEIGGYSTFARDPFGNIIQNRLIESSELSEVRRVLLETLIEN